MRQMCCSNFIFLHVCRKARRLFVYFAVTDLFAIHGLSTVSFCVTQMLKRVEVLSTRCCHFSSAKQHAERQC